MINEFEPIKNYLFKELNSFKKQLLETSGIDPSRIQWQPGNINVTARPSFYFKKSVR